MKNYKLSILLVIGTIGIALFIALSRQKPKEKENPSPQAQNQPSALTQSGTQVPEAQMVFVHKVLMPSLDDARNRYPVESVRQKIDLFMGRIQRNEVRLTMHTEPAGTALAAANAEQRDPYMMRVFVPTHMGFFTEIGYDRASYQDEIIATFLHEEYHLNHHMAVPGRVFDHHKAESEAWWWTIEEIYLPMRRAGRLRMVDNTVRDGIHAYTQANGNPQAKSWTNWIKQVMLPVQTQPPR